MKVKVKDTVYDGAKEPVMVMLTEKDKSNIKNMHPATFAYCVAPKGTPKEEVEAFMETSNEDELFRVERTWQKVKVILKEENLTLEELITVTSELAIKAKQKLEGLGPEDLKDDVICPNG